MILKSQDSSALPSSPQLELDNGDDDDLDPAMKEELDREVEDFAQRLNSHWPERMQELLLGQERRLGPYRGMSVVLCIHIHVCSSYTFFFLFLYTFHLSMWSSSSHDWISQANTCAHIFPVLS
ncbi:uncharacterized protein LOC119984125 isoform X2 [Tripterygium wilfordii]|nr:uncharacterized protein LOC119984125 isoform X2 [Tripterygium wilfordii]